MNIFKTRSSRGFIQLIIIIVVALLVLSYLGYNLRDIANSPTAKANFTYVGEVLSNIWNNYLKAPVLYLWNIFVTYIWNPAIDALKNNKAGSIKLL